MVMGNSKRYMKRRKYRRGNPHTRLFPFFNSDAFFGRLPFALLVLLFRAALSSVSLSKLS